MRDEPMRMQGWVGQGFQACVGSLPLVLMVLALLFCVVAWYRADAEFARRVALRTVAPSRAYAYLQTIGFPVVGDIVCHRGDVSDATYCDASSGGRVVTVRCAETCYLVNPPQE
jgi:hypothetical protein